MKNLSFFYVLIYFMWILFFVWLSLAPYIVFSLILYISKDVIEAHTLTYIDTWTVVHKRWSCPMSRRAHLSRWHRLCIAFACSNLLFDWHACRTYDYKKKHVFYVCKKIDEKEKFHLLFLCRWDRDQLIKTHMNIYIYIGEYVHGERVATFHG